LAQQVEINNPEELEDWLADKSKEWAQVMTLRSALRVLPCLNEYYGRGGVDDEVNNRFIINVLRGVRELGKPLV